ncbi:MAG: hypothetical protein ABJQ34_05775 [Paracoccaceae bacterium]
MTPEDIQALFTRSDDTFLFARWGRPIVPIVFGVEDETLGVIKGAIETLCLLTGHKMAETDPELGANFMWFFFRDWSELPDVPGMDKLVDNLGPIVKQLEAAGANQYRVFRFDDTGAIKAAFVFLRMDSELESVTADTLALVQAVQSILLWSDTAFRDQSALARAKDTTVLRPDVAALLCAAYDPVMPHAANDPSHALRLAARVTTNRTRALQ